AVTLAQGVYLFELKVTDNNGNVGLDTMQVTVNAAPVVTPVANAGSDVVITLPVDNAVLNGSGTDADGTVISYQWTKISGPGQGSISNATQAQTTAVSLVQVVYIFELKVTDNNGNVGLDTMKVTVNAMPVVPPVANA